MKLNKLHAAVVAATAFASTGAFAGLNLNGINPALPAVTPAMTINIAGASASDKGFKDVMDNLCVAGTLSIYTDTCTTGSDPACAGSTPKHPGAGYSAYFCTVDRTKVTGWSGATNINVLFRKRSAGGSGWGVQPVSDAAPISMMALNPTNCKVTATADVFKCGSTTENVVADLGISDAEPALFKSPNVPAGFSSITNAQIANLDVRTIAALTFGIPVTNALYGALQAAQGLDTDLDGDNIVEGTSETATQAQILANMPSMTDDQIGALLKGSIGTWDSISFGGTDLLTVAANAGLPVPANTSVTICRRVDGSGTQAVANAMFLNVPCNASAGFAAADNTICHSDKGAQNLAEADCTAGGAWARYADQRGLPEGEAVVFENSGSGDVEFCLNDLQGVGTWALGVQSLEKTSTKYSYLKINGAAPTLQNVATGNYMDWASSTMQYRKALTNGIPAPAGNAKAIMNQLRVDFAKPAVLKPLNDTFGSSYGPVGWLSATATPVVPFNPNLPIMQFTRGASGMSTCNAQVARGTFDMKKQ
ncbi:MAG: hypothetical protein HPY82_03415 [Gammaproteobacteria bacterium]|nr:hypothetical protein [Gammaproteobacteria bacterium]